MVTQQLALLDGAAPSAAMFRLPLEQEPLRLFLLPTPRGFGRSYRISNQCIPPAPRLAASLPGCAVSESPVWRFDASRGEVIGSRVSLRAVSERLRMPDLVAPGNEVLASAALAQALLRSSPPVLHQFAERGRPSLTH